MSLIRPHDSQVTGWALAARAGDQAAAAAFVRATQAQVWRMLAHLTDPGNADDLAQETYLRAFRSLDTFTGQASARTWLLAIARRVAADHLRAAARRPKPAGSSDWQQAAELRQALHSRGVPGFDDGFALRELLAELEPDRREAFVLTQVVGLSYAEAAQVCGCPIGTIRSRVARARDDLITRLRAAESAESTGN
ncbi:RNA polymerase [Carbonactinospora thermoautotrophica]|uniref:RNA polymerase sigma factor n=1 Tax=Carbonactinospora thermoautotrophica TaxID=1469144 RepID=A0A132MWK5_9ACTN|nr:sigma-70 family RNA polymerase sigma factor [Carbonactinospora thermoautotrophica]KWX02126.1 RNA polymerase [Carbonactinospora thermoautotrophica]